MMKIAIFGGTGYVGSHLVDALVAQGHVPRLLVREGSEARVRQSGHCETVAGELADPGAISSTVDGADAVIYNVGILREVPARGITFDAMHNEAARHVIDAAAHQGVRRFILMSANGAKQDGTAYQRTKFEAEQYLACRDLDWTVIRPSVIFGDPRGRMEFATQLFEDIVDTPLPAPLFYPGFGIFDAGSFALSPVHVGDVARAFVALLQDPSHFGRIIHLGGPENLSWREILSRIATATGRRKTMIPVPAFGVRTAASLLDRFEQFPITREQLQMLLEGNTCDSADLRSLGIEPRSFDSTTLDYLGNRDGGTDTWHRNVA